MISTDHFRQYARSLPKTDEAPHFEATAFRVKKKIFATLNAAQGRATLKFLLEMQDIFSSISKGTIFPIPNKWGQHGWTHLILWLLLLILIQPVEAQKIYQLHLRTELTITGIGFSTGIAGVAFSQYITPLTPVALALLDRKNISPIDRKSTYWLSGKANRASDVLLYSTAASPLLFLFDQSAKKEALAISVLYAETLTLTVGITDLTKSLARRTRPYAYNLDAPADLKQRRDARKSFFSGHTSTAAASCFFVAKVWSDMHPYSRWKPMVWVLAASAPAATGYLRMRAGRHYFTDVVTGYAVGAMIGWLVPTLHQSARFQKTGLEFYSTPQGAGLVWKFYN